MKDLFVISVFLFISVMWISGIWRLWRGISLRSWAVPAVQCFLFWGPYLIIEAFWWFWPEGIVHALAMGSGGLFGVFWAGVYIFRLRGSR